MKDLLGFNNLPLDIKNQIEQVVFIWTKYMGDNLVGIYLHGSIVLDAFWPNSGDIDILIVVNDSIPIDIKLAIAKDIIVIDKKPRPLEMSAIKLEDAKNWVNDGNCVFHYSDYWTERYLERFLDDTKEVYVVDHEFPDADVTSYIKLINQSGITLYGSDKKDVFSEISDKDFWKAISSEVEDYEFDNYDPRYFASNILILGRILSFKITKKILSKYDAGLWMIDFVPENLRPIPEAAMKVWFEGKESKFDEVSLEQLRVFLIDEIRK